MKTIQIADRLIGEAHPPFVVAEMSGNHNQSLERALAIIDAAAVAGAHGLKIQTYTADTMTLDLDEGDFLIEDPNSLWQGQSLYKLYQRAFTPWEWHEAIFKRCHEHGMIGFSTPFDLSAVDFLEKLDVPAFKIASFENHDLPLIRRVAQTGKPIIISTGMASIAELDETVQVIRESGNEQIILLKCTSSYPATAQAANVRTIPHLRDLFKIQVGLSDHTIGIGVAIAAIALGATLVEKHLTLARSDGGVDSAFSLEPHEMKALVQETERAWQSLGEISYGIAEAEKGSLKFRRSIYVAKNMRAGEQFTKENLRVVRPGFGLPPRHYDILVGKRVVRDVKKGTPLSWDLIE